MDRHIEQQEHIRWMREADQLLIELGRHEERVDQLNRDICQHQRNDADGTPNSNGNGKGTRSPAAKSDLKDVSVHTD